MMTQADRWTTIYDRFDPLEPVPLDKPEWHVRRPYSPVGKITRELNRPFGNEHKHYLLIGTVGTGKSSELNRIAEARTERDVVVIIDLWRHFVEQVGDPAALDQIQPWEVLFLIGVHLIKVGDAIDLSLPKALRDQLRDARLAFAADDDQISVDIAALAAAVSVGVGGVVGGPAGAVLGKLGSFMATASWDHMIGRGRSAPDQEPRVRDMLAAVNNIIGYIQERRRSVALFVDGLDRVENLETCTELFVKSALLGKLVCKAVFTGSILVRQAHLAGRIDSFTPMALANVPVLDQQTLDHKVTPVGRDFFRELWTLRARAQDGTDDLTHVIPDTLVDTLAFYSGGRVREFVRMVRVAAGCAYDDELDVANETVITRTIDEERRRFEMGINADQLKRLRRVMKDPKHELLTDKEYDRLLNRFYLLPYPNESTWYYPNPLLLLHKLRGSDLSEER